MVRLPKYFEARTQTGFADVMDVICKGKKRVKDYFNIFTLFN